MFQLREGSGQPDWEELLVKPVMVPAAAPLERLLRLFQEQRRHMAVVLDVNPPALRSMHQRSRTICQRANPPCV